MKQCLKCGKEVFITRLEVAAQITIDDNGKITIMAIDDSSILILDNLVCECGESISKDVLLSKKCNRCNELFAQELINENGYCYVCQGIIDRFTGVTQDQLINRILELEKKEAEMNKKKRKSTTKKEETTHEPVQQQAPVVQEPVQNITQQEAATSVQQQEVINNTTTVSPTGTNVMGNQNLLNNINFGDNLTNAMESEQVQAPVMTVPQPQNNVVTDFIPQQGQQEVPMNTTANLVNDFNNWFNNDTSGGFNTIDLNNIGGSDFML